MDEKKTKQPQKRIGVFVCHCGINIAGTVKIDEVLKKLKDYPSIAVVKDHQYCCSDPGQNLIKETIVKEKLDGVVVACCSPNLHELTFRKAAAATGINPYLCEIANIREQCSWVTEDKDKATEKAVKIIKTMVRKVQYDEPLMPISVPITKRAMVIGAGVAGIQSALDIANAGYEVVLVEKNPSIGGHMAQLSETFPTLDCSQCILTPKMVEVKQHPNIKLLTYSEVMGISGYVGNFKVKVNKKTRYILPTKCNGCGDCAIACPVSVSNEFDAGLSQRKAVYRPFPQAVPNIFTIEKKGISPCRVACPAGVNAHGYVALIAAGKYQEALDLERQANPFASVCGRVCNHPCEMNCNRAQVDKPIAICSLKRFIADYELKKGRKLPPPIEKVKFDKTAIIGGGPAGLACAYFLAKKGYPVTIFEALPELGGMLITGIPEFRLPRPAVKADIDYILAHGIDVKTNQALGKDFTIEDLFNQGYKAVFLATGAAKSLKLGIPGENLNGVYPVLEFLRDLNLKTKDLPSIVQRKKVVVIGGGNAAVDAARTSFRLGANEVTIIYRRSRREMPANEWEIEEAEKEGVKIVYLAGPTKILGRDNKVIGIECQKMELGAPDATGRRMPIPIPKSEFTIETDIVIPAVSQAPDTSLFPDLEKTRWGAIVVNPDNMMTSQEGIFAGGDLVSGPATVIEAVAAGKRAAQGIELYLKGEELKPAEKPNPEIAQFTPEEYARVKKAERSEMPKLPIAERRSFKEVELGFSEEEAKREAQRCLNCSVCAECMECVKVCEALAIDHNLLDETEEFAIGSLVIATGYEVLDKKLLGPYGAGKYPDVIDGLQFERILSASGPTSGEVRRPSDGKVPKRVVFVQCAGSRDPENAMPYCSKVCCMYTAKHAMLYKHRVHDGEAIIFYIDVRTGGKGFEEFYKRATDEGVLYIRGKVSKIFEQNGKVTVFGADTLTGKKVELDCDMVVLATAMVPTPQAKTLSTLLKTACDENGWFVEAHPKLRPVETMTAGFYLAGAGQGPKDIPEAVAQASGAASKVIALFAQKELQHAPVIAGVLDDLCSGCGICVSVCPYQARELELKEDGKTKKIKVIEVLCEGCGACSAACPSGAAQQKNFADTQIQEMVKAGLEDK
uniref:FAD-dependent oxidoreductase n=1 Tax=candidate division WOR-3 bacterium TaxID=2052148 RepID=A0A7C6A9Z8_UNCW3